MRAHLLRWRPRQPAQRTESTPRALPSGAASQLDPPRPLLARGGRLAPPLRTGESAVATTSLPPLISSDGHLEVLPERWTVRMPARYRDKAPRTIKMPDGGDALLVEGQEPRPVPFLDLRAGRSNETWQPFGVTVADTAGVGPPEQRIAEQDQDGLEAEVLFPNMQMGPRLWRTMSRRRRVPRGGSRVQRLARRGVLRGLARPSHRARRHPVDEPGRCRRRARALREARPSRRDARRVPQRVRAIRRRRTIDSGRRPSR